VIRRSEVIKLANPIVDGGVWANFPLFVFRDERFREFHGLPELKEPQDLQVMGFLLEESQLISTGQRRARFAEPLSTAEFRKEEELVLPAELGLLTDDATMMEIVEATAKPDFKPESLSLTVRQALISKGGRVSKLVNGTANVVTSGPGSAKSAELPWLSIMPGRRGKFLRSLRFASQALRGRLWWFFFGFTFTLLALGIASLWGYARHVHPYSTDYVAFVGPALYWVVLIVVSSGVLAIGLLSLFVGNFYFARATDRYGYLVASTLASAGSVRYWMDGDPRTTIIRIPVPEDLRTLAFRYVNVDVAIATARASVADQLESLTDRKRADDADPKTREERVVESANGY
jgi:hypothetical protein